MNDPDLNMMSEEKRSQYLSSLPLDELIEYAGARKAYGHVDGPAWNSLSDQQCHICHKPITDAVSLRLKIGSSDCRPRIEHELKRGSEMWDQVSNDELETIWTKFNIYGVYISDVAYKVQEVHKKEDLVIFDLQNTSKVLVKIGSQMTVLSREAARKLWEERK